MLLVSLPDHPHEVVDRLQALHREAVHPQLPILLQHEVAFQVEVAAVAVVTPVAAGVVTPAAEAVAVADGK